MNYYYYSFPNTSINLFFGSPPTFEKLASQPHLSHVCSLKWRNANHQPRDCYKLNYLGNTEVICSIIHPDSKCR